MERTSLPRIESKEEVSTYLQNLRYALEHGAELTFQVARLVDNERKEYYTNQYTVAKLFPNEDPVKALKRELMTLSLDEYMQTVKDLRFPNRSEMREFGRVYNNTEDVYMKIRVELLNEFGTHTIFIMSFHFAETAFRDEMFPYKEKKEGFR